MEGFAWASLLAMAVIGCFLARRAYRTYRMRKLNARLDATEARVHEIVNEADALKKLCEAIIAARVKAGYDPLPD
jgi:hypothetical protein